MKKFILTCFLFQFSVGLFAQETFFKRDSLIRDIDSIIPYLEEVHVNPYAIYPKDSMICRLNAIKKKLPDSLSLFGFYRQIAPVIARMNDGHTAIEFPNAEFKKINPVCLPFTPEITRDKKLIVASQSDDLPEGAEITHINGVSSSKIIATMIKSRNGEDEGFKIYNLNHRFVKKYYACFGSSPNYKVEYRDKGKHHSVVLKGMSYKEYQKTVRQKVDNRKSDAQLHHFNFTIDNRHDPFSFSIDDNQTGYLDFRDFSHYDDFETFLDTVFTVIKARNVENLIIDLRKNGGGNSLLGDELFQYISPVPYQQFGKTRIKYSNKREQFYKAMKDKEYFDDYPDSLYLSLFAHKPGALITEDDTTRIPLEENSLRFKGHAYLLTSNYTFSSANDFTWCFKYFKMGTIIGEHTGGYIVSFGDCIDTFLPVTNLKFYISHKEFYGYGATDKERHCVYPDYETDADNAFDYAIKLIKEKK